MWIKTLTDYQGFESYSKKLMDAANGMMIRTATTTYIQP